MDALRLRLAKAGSKAGTVKNVLELLRRIINFGVKKRAADLPEDFRPLHGLRHTFASVAVSHGVPLSHVQKLLTHKDPSLTQRYAHLEDSALKNSASLVGSFLEDVPGVEGGSGR